jgi:hypothetical protein
MLTLSFSFLFLKTSEIEVVSRTISILLFIFALVILIIHLLSCTSVLPQTGEVYDTPPIADYQLALIPTD